MNSYMSPAEAWRRLGIEPTDDKRAVRRAYADTLRAIDPGAKPGVFMALRDARDLALATGATPADDAWDDDDAWTDWSDADETGNDEDANAAAGGPVLEGWDGRSRESVFWGQSPLAAEPPPADTVFLRNRRTDEVPDPLSRDTPLFSESEGPGERDDDVRPTPAVDKRDDDVVEDSVRVVFTPDPGTTLYGLLVSQGSDVPLTATQLTQALGYLDAVTRDAEQSTIERHAEIDEWVANLLARNTPRSDPLIAPAGKLFGWETRTNDLFLPSALDHLVARQKGLNFVATVTDRKHPLSGAWKELTRPAAPDPRRGWFINRSEVGRLLDAVRRDHPFVEDEFFDERRVALWEPKVAASRGKRGFAPLVIVIIIIVGVLRLVAAVADDDRPKLGGPPAPVPIATAGGLRDAEADIDALLRRLAPYAPRHDALAALNPKLLAFLRMRWIDASNTKSSRSSWLEVYDSVLRQKIDAARESQSHAVVSARRRFERDTMRALLRTAPQRCEADLSRGPPRDAGFVANGQNKLDRAYTDYVTLALRELDPSAKPVAGETRFRVPGLIIERVIKLSGLSEARLRTALMREGSALDRCLARIALIDAALEAPQSVGLPILRGM